MIIFEYKWILLLLSSQFMAFSFFNIMRLTLSGLEITRFVIDGQEDIGEKIRSSGLSLLGRKGYALHVLHRKFSPSFFCISHNLSLSRNAHLPLICLINKSFSFCLMMELLNFFPKESFKDEYRQAVLESNGISHPIQHE